MIRTRQVRRGLSGLHITLIVIAVVVVVALSCGGLMLGLLLPALAKARDAAMGLQSTAMLSNLEWARDMYIQNHAEHENPPTHVTLQELIDQGYLTGDMRYSPTGNVSDGQGDYWFNPILKPDDEHGSPGDQRIASYDRAMYESRHRIAVCFYGIDCELVSYDEFQQILALPINADTDFNLPYRTR